VKVPDLPASSQLLFQQFSQSGDINLDILDIVAAKTAPATVQTVQHSFVGQVSQMNDIFVAKANILQR
jgi:hypothetical protein